MKKLSKKITLILVLFFAAALLTMVILSLCFNSVSSKADDSHTVIYDGRKYARFTSIDKLADLTEKRIDAKDSLDEENTIRDYYSASNYPLKNVIFQREYTGELCVYLSLHDIPIHKGKDIYGEIFNLKENIAKFRVVKNNGAEYCYYDIGQNSAMDEFFNLLYDLEFFYIKDEVGENALKNVSEIYIEAELNDGFIYSVRLLEGGYVIPCGAYDVCQKIPDDVYNRILKIAEDTDTAEPFKICDEYGLDKELEFENLLKSERYGGLLPTYIPDSVYHRWSGEKIKTDYYSGLVFHNIPYDKETGKIVYPELMSIEFRSGFESFFAFMYHIGINDENREMNQDVLPVITPEEISVEWILEHYINADEVESFRGAEVIPYYFQFRLDYGHTYIDVSTYAIDAEEVYKIIKSIDLL